MHLSSFGDVPNDYLSPKYIFEKLLNPLTLLHSTQSQMKHERFKTKVNTVAFRLVLVKGS